MSERSAETTQYLRFGAAFAVIAVVLIAGYWFFLRDSHVSLVDNLDPASTAIIVERLEAENVPYRLDETGAEVLVPSRALAQARIAISDTEIAMTGVAGWEIFNERSMGLTEFGERIKHQRALQGELTRTIRTLSGVADARIHIAMAEPSLFRREAQITTAAVSLIMEEGALLSEERVSGIQRLIAAAVPGLALDDVVILQGEGEVVSELPAELETALASGIEISAERAVELRASLRDRLQRPQLDVLIVPLAVVPPSPVVAEEAPVEDGTEDAVVEVEAVAISPAQPQVRLQVLIFTPAELTADEVALTEIVIQSMGIALPDIDLEFRVDEAMAPGTSEPTASPELSTAASPPVAAPTGLIAFLLFLIAGLVAVAGYLGWTRWGQGELNEDQREALATELDRLLQTRALSHE